MNIVSPDFVLHLTIGIAIGILALIAGILFLMMQKEQRQQRKKHISALLEDWLAGIVLDDDLKSQHAVPEDVQLLLKAKKNRLILLDELVTLKKNLSGGAAANLERLYNQLALDLLSIEKVGSRKWHVKAKGVQELAIMKQQQHLRKIYRYVNHPNIYVRMEVQAGLVQYWGAKGLRFLNYLTYPLTEWQQQKLLHFLLQHSALHDLPVQKWLSSSNFSVVQFALKYIGEQQELRFYKEVKDCLDHAEEKVRLQAITCLERLSLDDTTEVFACYFSRCSKECQVAILQAFQKIGTAEDFCFLNDCTSDNDPLIKLAAIKALQEIDQREGSISNANQLGKAS